MREIPLASRLAPQQRPASRLSNDPASAEARISDGIHRDGWIVFPGFLPEDTAVALAEESRAAWDDGAFRRAGVGRGKDLTIREDIRTDHVMWLRPGGMTRGQQAYLDELENLRVALNRRLFLGLLDFEGHFAIYPPGGFYKPHLDRHRQTMDRVLTAILYLNAGWQPGDGGELRLWTTPGGTDGPYRIVEPRLGTLVCFLAGDFWHEVLPAHKTRASITGWFRARS